MVPGPGSASGEYATPMSELFDDFVRQYQAWFATPLGRIILKLERELVLGMLAPQPGETILDAGCGTGIFTAPVLAAGAAVVGLELSGPMLARARATLPVEAFRPLRGDLTRLPLAEAVFDKALSVTALEFIADGQAAMRELFRVTRPGGRVVVATLNSLSPWAQRRRQAGREGHPLFKDVHFRSPAELAALAPVPGRVATAIHFAKDADPDQALASEAAGRARGLASGAFLVGCWDKPRQGATRVTV